MLHRLSFFLVYLITFSSLFAAPSTKDLYSMHCAACHQVDQMVVGPSLVEIRTLYAGKPDLFVKWCIEPQRKRAGAVEMPSMRHVPEADLLKIYEHIMKEAAGKREKGSRENIDLFPQRLQQRPRVQRIFMKDSGPASIAVALAEPYSFVWDAGECRLRQIWTGGFLTAFDYFKGNGDGLARPRDHKNLLSEAHSPLSFITSENQPRFHGYRMQDKIPTFLYSIGHIQVEERLSSEGTTLQRDFLITGGPAETTLTFPAVENFSYSSNVGTWDGTTLTAPTESLISITLSPTK